MDFSLTADQESLRSAAREFLTKERGTEFVRKFAESSEPYAAELIRQEAELGWQGLIIPEEFGGLGSGWIEVAVLAEEMGRTLYPGPLFSNLLAAQLLIDGGTDEQKAKYLPAIAAGELSAAVAVYEGESYPIRTKASPEAGGFVIEGTKLLVADASTADVIFVAAQSNGSLKVFAVDAASSGLDSTPLHSVDLTRGFSQVRLNQVKVTADAALAGDGKALLETLRDRACLFLAGELAGVAHACTELSVGHAKQRKQFDRPIGFYQAISHKIADMYAGAQHSTSLLHFAAWAADDDPQRAPVSAYRAKAWSAQAARKASHDAIQIHGGMGFTWEHVLHLYFRRARSNDYLFGDQSAMRRLVFEKVYA